HRFGSDHARRHRGGRARIDGGTGRLRRGPRRGPRRRSGLSLPDGRSDSRSRTRRLVHLAPRREDSSLERSRPTPFGALTMSELRGIGGDLEAPLETFTVPSYVIDPTGVIRWINPAARRLVGDVRGRQFTSVVAPDDTRRARETFARKIVGSARVTDAQVVLVDADGGRIQVDVSSCVLMDGHRLVGVFGQISDVEEEPADPLPPHLTPRQTEVLRLLKRGRSTEQIAQELHLSTETVRNHVRHLLRALGVHTRLEAVA